MFIMKGMRREARGERKQESEVRESMLKLDRLKSEGRAKFDIRIIPPKPVDDIGIPDNQS
jgi:hypothetical protein